MNKHRKATSILTYSTGARPRLLLAAHPRPIPRFAPRSAPSAFAPPTVPRSGKTEPLLLLDEKLAFARALGRFVDHATTPEHFAIIDRAFLVLELVTPGQTDEECRHKRRVLQRKLTHLQCILV